MFDCANVEMRELLPELAAGALDARTRARVEAHVADCAECASELDTLRLVREAFRSAPVLDTRRIVAALPKPPAALPLHSARRRATHWMDWRVAAALTMVTVGGLSVAVTQRRQSGSTPSDGASPPAVVDSSNASAALTPVRTVSPKGPDSATQPSREPRRIDTPSQKVQLALGGGGEADLDDAALRELLGALDDIERGPIAPSAEPDGSPVLPVIREGSR